MTRGYNFGAGPAMLPQELLLDAQRELLNWQGLDMSVMEIGHRTKEFTALMDDAELFLRKLLSIPSSYHVLFLGGPARLQFAMIPINLLAAGQKAGYFVTGIWSSMAYEEALRLKKAYCVASQEKEGFCSIPSPSEWRFEDETSYLYYTANETINGVRFAVPPKHDNIPLLADMTSCLLAEPININDFALIFAGAQKNIANAGLTLVIIHESLMNVINDNSIPTMLDYRTHVTNKSLYATPPTFNCYLALKMFQWIERQGGVDALYKINVEKAARLYNFIDSTSFYKCKIAVKDRSLMNVCFTLANPLLEASFLKEATQNGLYALKGHRTVGGLRASMYNSMPIEGVDQLIAFMADFARRN